MCFMSRIANLEGLISKSRKSNRRRRYGKFAQHLRARVERLEEWYSETDEDSYMTRNHLRSQIAQFREFAQRVEAIAAGKNLDLTERITAVEPPDHEMEELELWSAHEPEWEIER
jgi:hypothetical protein